MAGDDAYAHKPGGSLKLKGAKDKKKKKSKSSTTDRVREVDSPAAVERSASPAAAGGSKSAEGESSASGYTEYKTDSQRRFEEVQKRRLLEKAAKAATKTHKERVAEFNEKLENLSEHYDIPKVGPG